MNIVEVQLYSKTINIKHNTSENVSQCKYRTLVGVFIKRLEL